MGQSLESRVGPRRCSCRVRGAEAAAQDGSSSMPSCSSTLDSDCKERSGAPSHARRLRRPTREGVTCGRRSMKDGAHSRRDRMQSAGTGALITASALPADAPALQERKQDRRAVSDLGLSRLVPCALPHAAWRVVPLRRVHEMTLASSTNDRGLRGERSGACDAAPAPSSSGAGR